MSNAMKGVFYSGLVFPGLGQIVLKRYTRGAVFMLPVTAGLLVVFLEAVHRALAIVETLDSGAGLLDLEAIVNAATQATTTSGSLEFQFAVLLIFLGWLVATVDAYTIGRRKDLEGRVASQTPNGNGS